LRESIFFLQKLNIGKELGPYTVKNGNMFDLYWAWRRLSLQTGVVQSCSWASQRILVE